MTAGHGLAHDVRRILPLAWPVVVGQVALLGFATVDTALMARHSATDLAALAVGSAVYITVFIGLMGVVLAIGPIAGQLFGAGRLREAGHQVWQTGWLALVLALLGALVLLVPAPFLALARLEPPVADKVRQYLAILALALPASLAFQVFRGFNNAVSRPKAVMVFQVMALGVKAPLSWLLGTGVPAWGLPAMGVQGCALATVVAMWAQLLLAMWWLRRDAFYDRFELGAPGQRDWHWPSQRALLRLGLPMGLSIAVEVTGFAFMALFIARLGETAVAGHQIAANLVSLLFMVPLGLSSATSTLVAQRIGAGDLADARRLGWHGVAFGLAVAVVLGCAVFVAREAVVGLYTTQALVAAATLPLLAWVALFHAADALQTLAAFVLRAWRVATWPMVIYVLALWGMGLGGGYWLSIGSGPLAGARGFWAASTAGLTVAAVALAALLAWVSHARRPLPAAASVSRSAD
jgi:multidrug resistance protein, MATE family